MKTIITNATIVAHDKIMKSEISIEDGLITAIGNNLNHDNATIIDAKDCFVLPGGVDIHTCLAVGEEGKISKEAYKQNSLASLYGGTTTIVEEMDSAYVGDNSMKEYNELLRDFSYIDYSFHQNAPKELGESGDESVKKIADGALNGFPSAHVATYGEKYQNDENILEILRELSRYGATGFVSCESHVPIALQEELHTIKKRLAPYAIATTRPNFAEAEAFMRMSNLSRAGNVSLCADNISTKEVVDMLYKQVNEGLPISVSVNPLHLLFTEDVYKTTKVHDQECFKYLTHPPLRKQKDVDALWKAIADGLIHFVSSNHNGTSLKHKVACGAENILKAPVGVPSVELRLSLLYTHGVLTKKIDMQKLVEITATHVTRIAGLRSKGRIEAGTDADIVIFDPNHKKTISLDNLHENCDYSPYEGMELQGFAKHVFIRGEHLIEDFNLKEKEAKGNIVLRKPIAMR